MGTDVDLDGLHRPHNLGRALREETERKETIRRVRGAQSVLLAEDLERPEGTNEMLQQSFGIEIPYITRMAFAYPQKEAGNGS